MQIFDKELIKLGYLALDKKSCLLEMADLLNNNNNLQSLSVFVEGVLEREQLMSTGIGKGIAIPHARSSSVRELKIVLFILENELDFDAIDGEPVKIIFMIAVPENLKEEYMRVLSSISNFCRDSKNRERLLQVKNKDDIYLALKGINDVI